MIGHRLVLLLDCDNLSCVVLMLCSTDEQVGLEEPVSLFETLRQELVDALAYANDLQYQLDAALWVSEALEEKVVELSSQAQGASVNHSEIEYETLEYPLTIPAINYSLFCLADHSNVKEELHMNKSNDAGNKHNSNLLADEASMSLKYVVGRPGFIPATDPEPQTILGTSTDVVDPSKVRATTRILCPGVSANHCTF